MQARRIRIDPGDLAVRPSGELRPGGAQLKRVLRFLRSQLHKLLEFLDGSYPVICGLIGFRQLQMSLGLFRHQDSGALEFSHSLGISVEGQQTRAEQQSRGAIIRLKRKRLTKSGDRFRVVAAQLSKDTEVVIDERMFDSLPQGIGEDFIGGIQIAGLQRLNARADFCFEGGWQVLLRESTGGDPEKRQENDSKARDSQWKYSREHRIGPAISTW